MRTTHLAPRSALYKRLNIQPGEEHMVLVFGAYALIMGTAFSVFYACTTSLFLTNFDREHLPLAFVASGALVYLLGFTVQRLQRRWTYAQVNGVLMLFTVVTVGGLLLAGALMHNKWLYFVLFLWNRVLVFVNGAVFLAAMGRVFNFEQSKRLFNLIGMGDVISSIISFLSVPLLLKLFSSDQLLFVAFGCMLVSAGIMAYIRRRYHGALAVAKAAPTASSAAATAPAELAKTMGRSYYSLLFLLTLLQIFGLVYVDFMFSVLSKQLYPDKDSLASFLGLFFGICAVIELFIKLFLYNKLISTYSIRIGTVLLPMLLLFSCGLAALYGSFYGATPMFFAYIVLSRFFMSSIRRSVSDPAFQLLFQPIPKAERALLQSRIEGGPKALGVSLTGLLLLGLYAAGWGSMVVLSYVFVVVLVFWAISSFRIQGEYRGMLSEAIARSAAYIHRKSSGVAVAVPTEELAGPGAHPPSMEELGQLAGSVFTADRLRAAAGLGHSGRFYAYRPLLALLQDQEPDVREAAIQAAGRLRKPELWSSLIAHLGTGLHQAAVQALQAVGEPVIPALVKHLNQVDLPAERQADLVGLVNYIGGQDARRFLRQSLDHPAPQVRDLVVAGLARHRHRATVTERPGLLRQLDEQAELLVWLAAAELDLEDYPTDSALREALHQERLRLVPKVFDLLTLLYGDNQFDVISELITQRNQEIQGFLLELLGTLLPAEVKDKILPLFDDTSLAERVRKSATDYPQQQLSVEARLHDLINKDYTRLLPETKAIAMRELLQWHDTDPTALLVANAVAPEELLAETALYVLHQLNPDRFAELHRTLRARPGDAVLADRVAAGLPEQELASS